MLKCPKCVHLLALPLCVTNSSMTSCFFFFFIFFQIVWYLVCGINFLLRIKSCFFFKKKANNLLLNEFYFIVFNISPCNNQTFTQDNLHSTKKNHVEFRTAFGILFFFTSIYKFYYVTLNNET